MIYFVDFLYYFFGKFYSRDGGDLPRVFPIGIVSCFLAPAIDSVLIVIIPTRYLTTIETAGSVWQKMGWDMYASFGLATLLSLVLLDRRRTDIAAKFRNMPIPKNFFFQFLIAYLLILIASLFWFVRFSNPKWLILGFPLFLLTISTVFHGLGIAKKWSKPSGEG